MDSTTTMSNSNSTVRRSRAIVSCLKCRQKKLKCDREQPCNQCVKTGDGCEFSTQTPQRAIQNSQSPIVNTPDEDAACRRKKQPAVSCLECRRQKKKCDQKRPCDSCIRGRRETECTYEPFPSLGNVTPGAHGAAYTGSSSAQVPDDTEEGMAAHEEAPRSHRTIDYNQITSVELDSSQNRPNKRRRMSVDTHDDSQNNLGVIEDLQARVKKLERLLSPESAGTPIDSYRSSNLPKNANPLIPGLASQSTRTALMSPFEDARKFLQKMPKDSTMLPHVKQIKDLQSALARRDARKTEHETQGRATLQDMIRGIPDRPMCSRIVQAYLLGAEKIHHVLHMDSFIGRLAKFWDSYKTDAPFGFVPQLLMVITIATVPSDSYTSGLPASLSVNRQNLIAMVESWHDGLKSKQRLTLEAFQVKVLLVLSSHSTHLPNDLTWNATGALVRYAMCLGLHRDPTSIKGVSVFEAEMRRRLWATVLEMDLQTSLVFGMPTAVRADSWDCPPPSNVNDVDLKEKMSKCPSPKPLNEKTTSLMQVLLAKSLSQRMRTVEFIQTMNMDADESQRHAHYTAIQKILRDIPLVARPDRNLQEGQLSPNAAASQLEPISLDIHIRQFLFYLYRPFAMEPASEVFFKARTICRDAALVILSHQEYFEPQFDYLEAVVSVDKCWSLFKAQCQHTVLVASLSICWEIKMISSPQIPDNQSRELLVTRSNYIDSDGASPTQWTKARLIRVVEKALKIMKHRLDRPGGFLKDMLGLAVILQSVRSNVPQDRRVDLMRYAAIKVIQDLMERTAPNGIRAISGGMNTSEEQTDARYDNGFVNEFAAAGGFDMGGDSFTYDLLIAAEESAFDFDFAASWNLF